MSTEIDEAEAAARSFYSNTTFPDEPAKPAGETLLVGGDEQTAPEVKPSELPEAVKALRDQPERKIYSAEGTYRDALRRSEFTDTDPEMDKAVNAEISNIFQDLSISSTEASTLVTLARTPATEEQIASWATESNRHLATLGKSAQEDLQLARALVARDPRVGQMLNDTGLGSHPAVVEMLVLKAKSARLRGEI